MDHSKEFQFIKSFLSQNKPENKQLEEDIFNVQNLKPRWCCCDYLEKDHIHPVCIVCGVRCEEFYISDNRLRLERLTQKQDILRTNPVEDEHVTIEHATTEYTATKPTTIEQTEVEQTKQIEEYRGLELKSQKLHDLFLESEYVSIFRFKPCCIIVEDMNIISPLYELILPIVCSTDCKYEYLDNIHKLELYDDDIDENITYHDEENEYQAISNGQPPDMSNSFTEETIIAPIPDSNLTDNLIQYSGGMEKREKREESEENMIEMEKSEPEINTLLTHNPTYYDIQATCGDSREFNPESTKQPELQYGSLDSLLQRAEIIQQNRKEKVENLASHNEQMRLWLQKVEPNFGIVEESSQKNDKEEQFDLQDKLDSDIYSVDLASLLLNTEGKRGRVDSNHKDGENIYNNMISSFTSTSLTSTSDSASVPITTSIPTEPIPMPLPMSGLQHPIQQQQQQQKSAPIPMKQADTTRLQSGSKNGIISVDRDDNEDIEENTDDDSQEEDYADIGTNFDDEDFDDELLEAYIDQRLFSNDKPIGVSFVEQKLIPINDTNSNSGEESESQFESDQFTGFESNDDDISDNDIQIDL